MSKSAGIPGAEYVRMSTDMQDLSISVQREAIRSYAAQHGVVVVASYVDEGRSGLSLRGRHAMRQLLDDVVSPDCQFAIVLVYDVSRWGRFHDTDASAYHEYHCRLHGVEVVYVKEPFPADRSPFTTLMKSLKRAMAAEYSRELGVKVRAGHARAIELGFQMGERPGLGLRRVAESRESGQVRSLKDSERKSRRSEHIKWVPGPEEEIALVRRIFALFANTDITLAGIQRLLADEGVRRRDGRSLTFRVIRTILSSEAFIGNFVWGRRSSREQSVGAMGEVNPLRAEGVMRPIVDLDVWRRVQARLHSAHTPVIRSRETLLMDLRRALDVNPALSCLELGAFGCASHKVYLREFGSFSDALRLAALDPRTARDARRKRASRSHTLIRQFTRDLCDLLIAAHVPCSVLPGPSQMVLVGGDRIRIQSVFRRRRGSVEMWWRPKMVNWAHDYLMLVRIREDGTALDFLFMDRIAQDSFPPWSHDDPPPSVVRLRNSRELTDHFHSLATRYPEKNLDQSTRRL